MGEGFRMPTVQEYQELKDNTTSVWTTLNGVLGLLLTSNVNGNTIFIPAAGFYNGTTLSRKGQYGLYWTRDYYSSDHAHNMGMTSGGINPNNNDYRNYGFTVRAVRPGAAQLDLHTQPGAMSPSVNHGTTDVPDEISTNTGDNVYTKKKKGGK